MQPVNSGDSTNGLPVVTPSNQPHEQTNTNVEAVTSSVAATQLEQLPKPRPPLLTTGLSFGRPPITFPKKAANDTVSRLVNSTDDQNVAAPSTPNPKGQCDSDDFSPSYVIEKNKKKQAKRALDFGPSKDTDASVAASTAVSSAVKENDAEEILPAQPLVTSSASAQVEASSAADTIDPEFISPYSVSLDDGEAAQPATAYALGNHVDSSPELPAAAQNIETTPPPIPLVSPSAPPPTPVAPKTEMPATSPTSQTVSPPAPADNVKAPDEAAPLVVPPPADKSDKPAKPVKVNRPLWIAATVLTTLTSALSFALLTVLALDLELVWLLEGLAFIGGPLVAMVVASLVLLGSVGTLVLASMKLKKTVPPAA